MAERLGINKEIIFLSLFLIIVPFFFQNSFHFEIAIISMLNAIICLGLNLLMGYAGQVSLGHGAFAGLGAFVTVILNTNYGLSPLLSLGISILAMGLFALIISVPILKLKGHYLAMATLGVGIIIHIVLNTESELTGGPDGMGVEIFSVFGYNIVKGIDWYIIVAFFLLFFVWIFQNLIKSPFGRILRSIHDSEKAALTVGANVTYYKSYIFAISVVIATFAGSMYAFFSGFISPTEASFTHSIELVVMVVFGGLGRIYGAVLGAFIITVIPQLLTAFDDYETLIFGLIIIGVMIFMPKGIVSIFDGFVKKKASHA